MGLDHGYDTVVGGAGGHLSGGERQRVAIARAMMKNAPIVILDEATSYTDPENEAVIQDAIGRLTRGKTLIVIAHRLGTITDADQIAVVAQGKILDAGTHEKLLKRCPPIRSDVGGPHSGKGCGHERRRWQSMFDAYKRFFRFAGEQKGTWYKGMAFELLRSIFEALQFAALLIVLRALVEQNMTGATPWVAFGIMAVSVAGAALCWYLAHNSEGHANYRMCAEKRIHIGERMKYMPMGYFNAQSLGSLTAAATSTMEDLESMSFAVIARTVVGMIRTTIFSLAILCFDWRIGLVFLLGMLLFLWVNSLLLKKSRELSPGRLAAQTRLVDAVLEYIQGMSVVRAFHGDKAANQTLNNTIEETEQQNFKLERKRIPYNVLEQIVLRVTAVVAISAFNLAIPARQYDPVYLPDGGGFRFLGI